MAVVLEADKQLSQCEQEQGGEQHSAIRLIRGVLAGVPSDKSVSMPTGDIYKNV